MSETTAPKPKYEDILEEIDFIQEQKHVAQDYHAFVYWFITTLYGKDEVSKILQKKETSQLQEIARKAFENAIGE